VRVAVERALRVAVGGLVAGQVPDDEGLVAGGREEHVRAGVLLAPCTVLPSSLRTAYFSSEVARLVTQPEWPSRVPRRTSCSAIVVDLEGVEVLRSLSVFSVSIAVHAIATLTIEG